MAGGQPDVDAENRLDEIAQALVRVETDMGWVKEQLSNHLAHHNKFLFILVAAVLALTGALVAAIVT
ncbi:hypothetical protein LCGC14_0475080 [marine sediment metagenome]|uniref:Uncharacterized protein n=1 Tax=marine sediment metagenome TaxID=412755 RepID=A0A0F9SAV7_9ZZZZ